MKILVFTNLYPNNVWPNHGIFIRHRTVQAMRLNGWETRVVAPVPYCPPVIPGWRAAYRRVNRQESDEGVTVYHPNYVMIPKIGMPLQGLMMFLSLYRFVKRVREEFRFDLIDAHYVYPDGFAAVLLGKAFCVPTVVSARGTDLNLFKEFTVVRQLLRYTLRQSCSVICVSNALKEVAVGLGVSQQKVTVIPNGVDLITFKRMPVLDARQQLGIPRTSRVLLSAGRLQPNKGFHVLIKAVRILVDQYGQKDLLLVIVGDGDYGPVLHDLVSSLKLAEHVRMVGNVPHKDLYVYYNASDLFCLASEREGCPNVILEALACGIPVLASPTGGIPEILHSERFGGLVEGTERAWAATIHACLSKVWVSEDIRAHAQQYSWAKTGQAIGSVFEKVMAQMAMARSLKASPVIQKHTGS